MLTEGFIAMMALIAATALHPDDYFAINSTVESFKALGLQVHELPALSAMVGEDLMHRPGGAVSLCSRYGSYLLDCLTWINLDGVLVSLLYHVRSIVHHDFDRCWYLV